jgi:hypothetical protein
MFQLFREHRIAVWSAVGASLICAVLYVVVSRANEFSDVRAAVAANLKDPDSARFENIKRAAGKDDVICGYVSAKNSYNGYTGFISFAYIDHKRVIIADWQDDDPGEQRELMDYFKNGQCDLPYLH